MSFSESSLVLQPYVCDCGATASNRYVFICLKCKYGLTEVLVNLLATKPDGVSTNELANELGCPFTLIESELVALSALGCVALCPNIARWRLGAYTEFLPAT